MTKLSSSRHELANKIAFVILIGFIFILVSILESTTVVIFTIKLLWLAIIIPLFKYIISKGLVYFRVKINEKNRLKLVDQVWKVVFHSYFVYLEYNILQEVNFEWLWLPYKMFSDPVYIFHEISPSVQYLYMTHLALWTITTYKHIMYESKHPKKDYLIMLGHHLVTMALVLSSFHFQFIRVGVVVLFLHDLSDVPLDLLKISNYLQLERHEGFYTTEILFVLNLLSWLCIRLYIFPFYVIYWGSLRNSLSTVLNMDGSNTLAYKYKHEELNPTSALEYKKIFYVAGPAMNGLLIILVSMHCYWFYLMFSIGLSMVFTESSPHEAGRHTYEGDSAGDEDDNVVDDKNQKNKNSHKIMARKLGGRATSISSRSGNTSSSNDSDSSSSSSGSSSSSDSEPAQTATSNSTTHVITTTTAIKRI